MCIKSCFIRARLSIMCIMSRFSVCNVLWGERRRDHGSEFNFVRLNIKVDIGLRDTAARGNEVEFRRGEFNLGVTLPRRCIQRPQPRQLPWKTFNCTQQPGTARATVQNVCSVSSPGTTTAGCFEFNAGTPRDNQTETTLHCTRVEPMCHLVN